MASSKPKIVTLDDYDRDLIPSALLDVLKQLRRAGHDAYVVGGCIRDYLLGREPKDFDAVTDAKPQQIRTLIPGAFVIGRRFLLVHARRGDTIYEIATYRKEASAAVRKHGHASHSYATQNTYGNQRQDAFRRDFTVNALYFDPSRKRLIDYVGGLQDLDMRVLRSIGPAEERFAEDPVRIIRAARFAAKLDFSLDDNIREAIHVTKPLLREVKRPRLRDELTKLFLTGHGLASYRWMRELHLLAYVFPQHPKARPLVEQAMIESDERIAAGHPLSTAYLFAVMLWHFYVDELKRVELSYGSDLDIQALRQLALQDVGRVAKQYVTITNDTKNFIFDIFAMQPRLERKRISKRTLAQPRLRAAVHLLALRAKVSDADPKVADWWQARQPERSSVPKRQAEPSGRRVRRRRRPRESTEQST